jgi:DNA-binding NarL/FixJ family response regulator
MGKKVLGMDLSKVTMTDAIAAMVDAWLDEQELAINVHLDQEENINDIRRSAGAVQRQVNDPRMDQILQLRNQGKTYRQIASEIKISKGMVGYLCKIFDGATDRDRLP